MSLQDWPIDELEAANLHQDLDTEQELARYILEKGHGCLWKYGH
jgi:hypothetical protein